ncbi:MAG TPA: hypothetical protein VFC93_21855 [Chloroflexota bacterium]|nr:hypothetical protein [Chloroflexota bacterium]
MRSLGELFDDTARRDGYLTPHGVEAYISGRLLVRRLPPGLADEPVPEREIDAWELAPRYGIAGWALWLLVAGESAPTGDTATDTGELLGA